MAETYDLVIIGGGAAGFTAGMYGARDRCTTLVLERLAPGGQVLNCEHIENYPGFPDGIMGPDLMDEMRKQAERFGAKCVLAEVTSVDLLKRPFTVLAGEALLKAETLIISSGASAKLLGLDSERRLLGHGVSTCATCDGFFFKDKEVIVVGGGDTAVEEAVFLTKYATKVFIIHRRDKLRASKIMQERVFKNKKIEFIWDSIVVEILGDKEKGISGVKIRNVNTGEIKEKACQGVFVAIGHTPNTRLFEGQLEMDERGYIITKNGTTETSVSGVFASGDVQDHRYRQAITAAGTGCMAAMDAEKFLEEHGE